MIMQVIACMYSEKLSVLCDDKQIIQQRDLMEKYRKNDACVDICLSDRRTRISLQEVEDRKRERETYKEHKGRTIDELISLASVS